MSLTLVMQEEKRGESSKKGPRLPLIAPKDDHSSSNSSSRSQSGPSVPPRARLPPRSRTGCWTCRTRKVKCDEGRPSCGQCTRLGHMCDYSPRLSFRDDTPRVVERMQDITIVGSSVWDSNSPAPTETSTGSQALDDLPPFAQLLNDEERERKAERSNPGTYHVLVNPESFQHLPEYSDESDAKRERISPLRRGSLATSLASSLGEGIALANDPNIVVLPKFEDVSRRVTSKEPQSPTLVRVKTEDDEKEQQPSTEKDVLVTEEDDGDEEKYWHQFRTVVWKHMVPAEVEQLDGMKKSSAVILEKESETYRPLYHAIMAVAAFSLEEGRLQALQHYQRALTALQNTLKSTEDLSSDGSFWTHFLLLLYEIVAADANVWRQHLSTILRISSLRRDLFGGERYPFSLWWICLMDIEAMFSGAGSGEFVGTLLEQEIVPPPSFHLYPLGVDASSVVYGAEFEFLPSVLQIDFEVTVLASRVALLSNDFRAQDRGGEPRSLRSRQGRTYELQEALRQVWATPAVSYLMQNLDRLSIRPRRLFEHAYLLYRACIIYSHTSMWSTQRSETSPEYDTEIAVASNQILSTATKVLEAGQTDARSMAFPIFIAGYASSDGGQKVLALEMIQKMEKDAIGMNTAASRQGLEMVYRKQNERFMVTGQSLDVDWRRVLEEEDLTILNFGL